MSDSDFENPGSMASWDTDSEETDSSKNRRRCKAKKKAKRRRSGEETEESYLHTVTAPTKPKPKPLKPKVGKAVSSPALSSSQFRADLIEVNFHLDNLNLDDLLEIGFAPPEASSAPLLVNEPILIATLTSATRKEKGKSWKGPEAESSQGLLKRSTKVHDDDQLLAPHKHLLSRSLVECKKHKNPGKKKCKHCP
ncbi:hypothetical protein NE237_018322 [Protea cynaroides]|uniref:Uncharacterized protein n=1 Tax=Protea cynaroides TaxID=273540 RepID=A0A9Q0K9M6_9MAGN|nr:hypothetical protein NE237_018322 [Protea cynaroides]